MTEADIHNSLERLSNRNKHAVAPAHLRARIDARIRETRRNYVKWPYAAAFMLALGLLAALQISRLRARVLAEQTQTLITDYLLPTNMLYHEQE
jgi:hypothetical protein